MIILIIWYSNPSVEKYFISRRWDDALWMSVEDTSLWGVRVEHQLDFAGHHTEECHSKMGHRYLNQWLGACLVPIHYMNLLWHIVDRITRDGFQWNMKKTGRFSFYKIHLKMSSDKWRSLCLSFNTLYLYNHWHVINYSIDLLRSMLWWFFLQ